MLVDAGFTRADGHRLVAEVLDSGKALTKVFISHADPDFYWGAEVIADAFPDAELVATPLVIEHIQRRLRGQAQGLGAGRCQPAHPPGRARSADRRHRLRGPPLRAQGRPPRTARPPLPLAGRAPGHRRRRAAVPATSTSGSPTPPPPSDRAAWIDAARRDGRRSDPSSSCPATACPPPRPTSAHRLHPRLPHRVRGGPRQGRRRRRLTEALVARYPDAGMLIAAQLGAKVAKGEMTWG